MNPRAIRRFGRDREASVAIIFALTLVPMMFLIGMAFDYTAATWRKSQLDAAADAAALAAVTPAMMAQPDANAITAATNIFNAKASLLSNLNYSPATNLSVTVADNGLSRTVKVSYTASSKNSFPNVLNQTSWAFSGSAQSTSSVPPNIDFYLLLDNSPSMAIAATPADIKKMVDNTPTQGGCAFACHESHPSSDNLGNPGGEDNYTLAKNLGVVTRIQNLAAAVQQLTTTATNTMATSNSSYRMAIYTFNVAGKSTVQALTSNMATAQTAAGTIDVLEVYDNNCLTKNNCNNDEDTDFSTAMSDMNATGVMPAPGTGGPGSTPQEVLFIVTDGVEDKNSATCNEPLQGGSRCQQEFDTTWCTTIKNRGIRIAVLYTVYYPLPSNNWYNSWIAPFQSNIGPNLQSCASPGLFFQVSIDQDIAVAMKALFLAAVQSARLSQ